ncbi:MAG: pyridine nucleotide-disulfide oxidoreductase [Hyphomicrobiaceae bacterium]
MGARSRKRRIPDDLLARYVTRPAARLVPVLITLGVLAAVATGWYYSDEGHLTPENGIGYYLGIIGASAMLLLLVYPMRKRMPSLRFLGTVPFWFKVHMLLGVLGPVLIIFHSNYKLGALNSNVAFIVMLIVAGSGVIGRYIYGKVHLGLNGRKVAIKQILEDAAGMQRSLGGDLPGGSEIIKEMSTFADLAMAPKCSATQSFLAMLALGFRAQASRARLVRRVRVALAAEASVRGWSRLERRDRQVEARELIRLYFAAINKAAKFSFYERLFALWHVLHLPLFILLIAAVLVHVVAVHLY